MKAHVWTHNAHPLVQSAAENDDFSAFREALARDIHDSSVQQILATLMRLDVARQVEDPTALHAWIDGCEPLLREALASLRHVMTTLGPIDDESPDLDQRLADVCQSIERDYAAGIRIHGRVVGVEVPAHIASEACRTIAEALRNACKHSRARTIVLYVACAHSRLSATIADDGDGFPFTVDCSDGRHPLAGNGTAFTVSRIHALGGTYTLRSTPGRGVTVCIDLPVDRDLPMTYDTTEGGL